MDNLPENTRHECALIGACIASPEAYAYASDISHTKFCGAKTALMWRVLREWRTEIDERGEEQPRERSALMFYRTRIDKDAGVNGAISPKDIDICYRQGYNSISKSDIDAHIQNILEAYKFKKLRGDVGGILEATQLPSGKMSGEFTENIKTIITDIDDEDINRETLISQTSCEAERLLQRFTGIINNEIEPENPIIETGFARLDEMALFQPAKLAIVGAESGKGKTTFCLNLAAGVLERGYGVVFFSFEMSKAHLINNLLSIRTGIPTELVRNERKFKEMSAEQRARYAECLRWISGEKTLAISEKASVQPDEIIQKINSSIIDWQGRPNPVPIGLVVVDYLQDIEPIGGIDRPVVNQHADYDRIINRLYNYTKNKLTCPMILTSQLNGDKTHNTDGLPDKNRIRNTRKPAERAQKVMFIVNEPNVDESGMMKTHLVIRKNRDGNAFKNTTFDVNNETMRFEEADEDMPDEYFAASADGGKPKGGGGANPSSPAKFEFRQHPDPDCKSVFGKLAATLRSKGDTWKTAEQFCLNKTGNSDLNAANKRQIGEVLNEVNEKHGIVDDYSPSTF